MTPEIRVGDVVKFEGVVKEIGSNHSAKIEKEFNVYSTQLPTSYQMYVDLGALDFVSRPKKKKKFWLNLYPYKKHPREIRGEMYESKSDALNSGVGLNAIAIAQPIEIEVEAE